MVTNYLRLKRVIAIAVTLAIASSGTSPILAASLSNGRPPTAVGSEWSMQLLDTRGETRDVSKIKQAGSQLLSSASQPGLTIDQMREQALAMQASPNPRVAAKAKHLLSWIDILSAKTASERHRRIRQLPVQIVETAATDGRNGAVKSFVAGGKTRIRIFVPALTTAPFDSARFEPPSGAGPFVPENTGRWKIGGPGGCYWDPDDSGPDQCDTDGRWKSDGQGGCYWDQYDGGPDQCTPPPNTCYDGEAAPCLTWGEMDDLFILIADAEAENDYQIGVYDAEAAELEAYCNENPQSCGEPSAHEIPSGPSAFMNDSTMVACGAQVGDVVLKSAASVLAVATAWSWTSGAAMAGVALAAGSAAVITSAFVVAGLGLALAVNGYIQCKRQLMPTPVAEVFSHRVWEPVQRHMVAASGRADRRSAWSLIEVNQLV